LSHPCVAVYRYSLTLPLITETYGIFKQNAIIDQRSISPVTSVRRRNLQKTHLRASMVITNNNTLNHLTDYHDKHIDTITKVNYILTNHLVGFLNATVSYSVVPTWGYLNTDTGIWSGMIGELTENFADLGASPLFFTIDRVPVIEYLAMTSETRSKFIFRSPKLSYTDNVFLLPFDKVTVVNHNLRIYF
jgi:glutamate receptor, ionotropic, invertebrate